MSQRSLWSYYVKRKKPASSAVSGLGTQDATQSSQACHSSLPSRGSCLKPNGGDTGEGEAESRDITADSWRDASSSCLAGNKRLRGGEAKHVLCQEEDADTSRQALPSKEEEQVGIFSCGRGAIHEQQGRIAEGSSSARAPPQAEAQADPSSWKKRFLAALGSGDVASKPGSDDSWSEARAKYAWLAPENIRDAAGRRPGSPDFDKRTVLVPHEIWAKFSASQKQYWNVKQRYMDTCLFFKVGTFYELYELDAEIGQTELDWKMTSNGVGKCRQVGVPESGIDEAVAKLVARGYKVGRMEQTETGSEAKAKRGPSAMVSRELTQVLSAATKCDGDLHPDAVHLLALAEDGWDPSLSMSQDAAGSSVGFAFVDAASGRLYVGSLQQDSAGSALGALLTQVAPQEIIFSAQGLSTETRRLVRRASCPGSLPVVLTALPAEDPGHPPDPTAAQEVIHSLGMAKALAEAGVSGQDEGSTGSGACAELQALHRGQAMSTVALATLLLHLRRLKWAPRQLKALELCPYNVFSAALRLDGATLANLELLSNSANGGTAGTLLGYLDSCACPGGKRLLRRWICHPLQAPAEIERRLDALDELLAHPEGCSHLRLRLRQLPDLERLIARVRSMAVPLADAVPAPFLQAREQQRRVVLLVGALEGLAEAVELLSCLGTLPAGAGTPLPAQGSQEEPGLESALLRDLWARAGAQDGLPSRVLSELLSCIQQPGGTPAARKGKLPKRRGSSAGHVGPHLVPPEGWGGPTARGAECEEAEEQAELQQQLILAHLVDAFSAHLPHWLAIADATHQLDVLLCFAAATASAMGPTCRPRLVPAARVSGHGGTRQGPAGQEQQGATFAARGLWHPYAVGGGGGALVPNDVLLGAPPQAQARAMLLTGPNMGGKSTLLRATCLAVIMAQMGCHVPAQELVLSPADVIFTRLGATDRIMSGESTFLVECKETAQMLRAATPNSLVILDELGRGTATFDGFAIAHAVLDHVTAAVDCRLLFATHYHALTSEFEHRSHRVGVYHMECATQAARMAPGERAQAVGASSDGAAHGWREGNGDSRADPGAQLLFLYKLRAGPCPKSYGLQVAAMAGIPTRLVQRASVAASCMEDQLKERFTAALGSQQLGPSSLAGLKQLCQMRRAGHSPSSDAILATWKALQKEHMGQGE